VSESPTGAIAWNQDKRTERVYLGSTGTLAAVYATGFVTGVCLILALVTMSTTPAVRAGVFAIACGAATWLFRRSVRHGDGGYGTDDPSVQPDAAWRSHGVRFRRRPLHIASIHAAVYSTLYLALSGLGTLVLGYGPAVPTTYAITTTLTIGTAILSRRLGPYKQVDDRLASLTPASPAAGS
jgi:hypothetical protein